MTVKGTTHSIQLTSANPAQPATGMNAWTFKVLDASGTPIEAATVKVAPWMPDHGHGPSVAPSITSKDGVYTATQIDFFMPGVWQLTFGIDVNGKQDQAVLNLCIAG